MNVFEMLRYRSEFEILVLNMRVPGSRKSGTLDNLKWYINEGHSKNRKFPDADRARDIAKIILSGL